LVWPKWSTAMMDHGFPVNEEKRCGATTKKLKRCSMPPLAGIELCALHSGLAKPRGDSGYGDPQALENYRRSLAAETTRRAAGSRATFG
jgi:hypothetical protein